MLVESIWKLVMGDFCLHGGIDHCKGFLICFTSTDMHRYSTWVAWNDFTYIHYFQTCSCFWHSFGRYHLKMVGWKTIFLLGWLPCRCNVSVREETIYKKKGFLLAQNFQQPIWNVNVPQVSTGFILKICFFFFFERVKYISYMKTALGGHPDLPQKVVSEAHWMLGTPWGFTGISDSQMFHTYIKYSILLIKNISIWYVYIYMW